jgi:uncharacterized protein (DUF1330 family)
LFLRYFILCYYLFLFLFFFWESVAKAIAGHDSPGYQAALKALGKAAERDVRIVEGVG